MTENTEASSTPAHQRPDSCHVCGSANVAATGRPGCSHDWTNEEALAEARAYDARTTVRYSTGASSAEELYVDDTRGR